jgi:hypothetical protein
VPHQKRVLSHSHDQEIRLVFLCTFDDAVNFLAIDEFSIGPYTCSFRSLSSVRLKQSTLPLFILSPLDSPEANRALESAIGLTKALHAELSIVTVVEPLPAYYSWAVSAPLVIRRKQP